MDVASFDSSDGLDAAEGRFGRLQGSKALTVAEQPFHGSMVALDQVVAPLSIDMRDAVEMRVIPMIYLANDAPVCLRLVRADCDWPMQSHAFNRLIQKGLGGLCISSRGQTEVYHLAIRIDGAPQIPPLTARQSLLAAMRGGH